MKSYRLVSLAVPLALLLASTGLLAQEPASLPASSETSATTVESIPLAPLGVTIFVDPETGQLTDQPTDEQRAWLQAERQRRGKTSSNPDGFQPRPVPLLGGGEGLALQDFVVSSTYIVVQPSGTWETSCNRDGVPHSHAAESHEHADVPAEGAASHEASNHDAAPVM